MWPKETTRRTEEEEEEEEEGEGEGEGEEEEDEEVEEENGERRSVVDGVDDASSARSIARFPQSRAAEGSIA